MGFKNDFTDESEFDQTFGVQAGGFTILRSYGEMASEKWCQHEEARLNMENFRMQSIDGYSRKQKHNRSRRSYHHGESFPISNVIEKLSELIETRNGAYPIDIYKKIIHFPPTK